MALAESREEHGTLKRRAVNGTRVKRSARTPRLP